MTERGRLRLRLGVVAVALAGAITLLAVRAVDAAVARQRLEAQVVTGRVVDSLEGELTALVATEEARPFFHWRAAYVPEGNPTSVLSPSPLADAEPPPFVRGWFQVDPDGARSSPRPDPAFEAELARYTAELSGWGGEAPQVASREIEVVVPAEPGPKPARSFQAAAPVPSAAPVQSAAPKAEPVAQASYVDVGQALNRGAMPRMDRGSQVQRAEWSQVDNYIAPNAPPEPVVEPVAPSPEPVAPSVEPVAPAPSPRTVKVKVPGQAPVEVDVELTPLSGQPVGDDLVLYRTVRIGERTWVQGLVVDGAALRADLVTHTVDETGLDGHVTVDWAGDAHRFAPPFDAWSASVGLVAVGTGPAPETFMGLLAALAAAVALAGVGMAYRSASTSIALAEQRADFVSAITHELRSPLTSIRLYAEMLEADLVPDDGKRKSYHGTIRAEAERLSRLVDDVLTFGRMEKGRPVTEGAREALSDAVERVLAAQRPQLAEAGKVVTVDLGDAATVPVPADVVARILGNLLDNARKFSGGADRIEITATGRLALTVRDHGPGVPRGQLGRIFDPFVRMERELQRRTQGTGIGLALVAGLARELGGSVIAENAPGGGLAVTVAWPASE